MDISQASRTKPKPPSDRLVWETSFTSQFITWRNGQLVTPVTWWDKLMLRLFQPGMSREYIPYVHSPY